MLSTSDATILRHIVSDPTDGDRAGWAVLALYSMGGFGDLSTEILLWLFVDDNGDRIHTAGPVVLASCVADLDDATACRILFEFAEKFTVKLELEPLMKQLGDEDALLSFLMKVAFRADRSDAFQFSAFAEPQRFCFADLRR